MKNYLKIAAAAMAAVLLISCQDVFTTSAYFWYEADISTMSSEQQVSYAADLLASGTASAEELQEAYAAVFATLPADLTTADPETLLLAADLAVGASGAGELVSTAIETFTSGDEITEESGTELLEAFNDLDSEALANTVEMIEAAESIEGAEISSDQYANAAMAQLVVVAANNGGIENLAEASLDAEDQEDLEQALEWAELGGFDTSLLGDFSI